MSASPTPIAPAWRTPALIVVAGVLIAILTNGPRTAMGLFLPPMTEANGWSRETFALALALQNIVWGMAQPIAGGFADKYGTSRVIIAGALVYAVSFVIMSQADAPFILHLSAGVMMGAAIGASSFGIVITAFSRLLPPENRQVGFGIATAGGSLGQFLFAPITQGFISAYGWHVALILLGAMVLAVAALAPVLAGRSEKSPNVERDQSISEALKEALSERNYILLLVGFFVCGFQVAFITAHFPAYVADLGIEPRYAVIALALIGLFNIVGSIASGIIGQRRSKPMMLVWIYLGRSVLVTAFLLLPKSGTSVIIFAAIMGLLWLSTVAPTNALVATFFGTRHLGLLGGIVFLSHQVGSFLGVWLGGYLRDQTGSYDGVWWLGVALGVFAAIVHWPIREASVTRPAAVPA